MVTPLDEDALIQASLDHFDARQDDYQRLADELPGAVSEQLRRNGLVHFRVEARAKRRDSYEAKLRKDPRREIEDFVGVRVLVFFRADIAWVEQVLAGMLMLDDASYVDKSELHADDSFGYRSVQFVGRTKQGGWDSEPELLESMAVNIGTKVEVQIRTVLEHAWAEVEHDFRYKPANPPSTATDRRFALNAALLEQADTNLDAIRDELASPAGAPDRPARGIELSRWELPRFIQSNRESLELDRRVAGALDLPIRRARKATREATHAAMLAGWRTYAQLQDGILQHGQLGLRLAMACADPAHAIILIDYPHHESARAFKGVGLYWTAVAVALGVNAIDPFSEHATIAIPDGRLAEYKVVATYLHEHPDISALTVRDMYRQHCAPAGTQHRHDFPTITLPPAGTD